MHLVSNPIRGEKITTVFREEIISLHTQYLLCLYNMYSKSIRMHVHPTDNQYFSVSLRSLSSIPWLSQPLPHPPLSHHPPLSSPPLMTPTLSSSSLSSCFAHLLLISNHHLILLSGIFEVQWREEKVESHEGLSFQNDI